MVQETDIQLECSLLSRADGSAKFSFGSTCVLASVNGPIEVKIRDELPQKATLEINVLPLRGLPGPSTKATAASFSNALNPLLLLHLHPRSLVQVTIQTLARPSTKFSRPFSTSTSRLDDSSTQSIDPSLDKRPSDFDEQVTELAAAFNALVCSLLDAGISMSSLAMASSACLIPSSDNQETNDPKIILNPNPEQQDKASATIAAAFTLSSKTPVWIHQTGTIGQQVFFQILDKLQSHVSEQLCPYVRQNLQSSNDV